MRFQDGWSPLRPPTPPVCRAQFLGFRVWGLEFDVWGLELGGWAPRFRIKGFEV